MDNLILLVVMFLSFLATPVVLFSIFLSHKRDIKKNKDTVTGNTLINRYEEDCIDSSSDSIKQKFLESSENKDMNIRDLHHKTLEILCADKKWDNHND